MKRIVYIFAIVLCFSCKEYTNKAPLFDTTSDVDYETTLESKAIAISEISDFETLSAQKLIEYFDLLNIKYQHPEFQKSINVQLNQFSKDSIVNFKFNDSLSVSTIKQIGEPIKVSDTLYRLNLEYILMSGNEEIKDSVVANITLKSVVIEGKTVTSNKVRFSKNK